MTQKIEFWRWKELKNIVHLGRTTVFQMYKNGEFPRPYKIGKAAAAWRSDEVLAWIETREKA